jgi:hypothetical protein
VLALLLAAGGVSWAATSHDASPPVLSACTSPASGPGGAQLSIVSGSCPAGDTQGVQWNQQGLQGPQGLVGPAGPPGRNASQATVAQFGQTERKFGHSFAVDYSFTATGDYSVQGNVTEHVDTTHWSYTQYKRHGIPGITCYMLAGPNPNGLAVLDAEPQLWAYFFGTTNRYYPFTVDGPLSAGYPEVKVTSLPYMARFQCQGTFTKNGQVAGKVSLPNTTFTDPSITVQPASKATLSSAKLKVVGPIKIIGPVGPGPVSRP